MKLHGAFTYHKLEKVVLLRVCMPFQNCILLLGYNNVASPSGIVRPYLLGHSAEFIDKLLCSLFHSDIHNICDLL